MDALPMLDHNQGMAEQRITYLRKWRDRRGLSQEDLASKTGLTQGMISHLETGESNFTGRHLALLSKALRCTIFELLFVDPEDGADSPLARFLKMTPEEQRLAVELAAVTRRAAPQQ